jgi:adenylosuccinate synthase
MRDVVHGAYPFVTSSHVTPAGLCDGAGVPFTYIDKIIGVMKAYVTAVGENPFPTELTGPEGEWLQSKGSEFGATTGRPRRCGWFDAYAAREAVRNTTAKELWLIKPDVMSGMDRIQICVDYHLNKQSMNGAFPTTDEMYDVEPIYVEMPGWDEDISSARSMKDLPARAQDYFDRIELLVQAPITKISVAPIRDAVIDRTPKIRI